MNEWLKTPLGDFIIDQEKQKCIQLVPSEYYARSLQIGIPWVNYAEHIEVSSRFIIDTQYPAQLTPDQVAPSSTQCHYAVSASSALPFAEKTHDLIILPHTLDLCPDPHEVLRQSSQTLVAEGCMVIIGFNLISFYGITKLLKKHKEKTHSVSRIQDWLALLGFDLVGAAMTLYQPPVQSQKWRDKLAFIEKIGDRWCPGLGGVYVIVGRKREMAVTTLPKHTQKWRRLIPAIAQPANSSTSSKIGLKLVTKN